VKDLESITARGKLLREIAALERQSLALDIATLAAPLQRAGRAWSAVRWLAGRPVVVALGAAALAAVAARGRVRWARVALGAWQAWQWANRIRNAGR
jgi:hypothetical protein